MNDTPENRLRAWVHWKKLEKGHCEDDIELYNSIDNLLKENEDLKNKYKDLKEEDELILKVNERIIATGDQLRKENKKLRELWAAVQKHSQGEKMWGNIQKIVDDLNKGNF